MQGGRTPNLSTCTALRLPWGLCWVLLGADLRILMVQENFADPSVLPAHLCRFPHLAPCCMATAFYDPAQKLEPNPMLSAVVMEA